MADDSPLDPRSPLKPLTVWASPAWHAWVDGLARECRLDRSKLVDHSLVRLAREVGYDSPPPPRR